MPKTQESSSQLLTNRFRGYTIAGGVMYLPRFHNRIHNRIHNIAPSLSGQRTEEPTSMGANPAMEGLLPVPARQLTP